MKTPLKITIAAIAAVSFPIMAGAATAQENWVKHCQKCHAADGSGSTPVGKKLKVLNYTDPAVQAKMTDEEIVKVTTEGAKNEAGKETMPGYKDKMTAEEIQAMVALIRSFQKS